MISPMAVHLNPELFEDPLKFDPWRWTVSGKHFKYSIFFSTHKDELLLNSSSLGL